MSSDDDLEETHTFRCEITDFKDFLQGKTQYRYEIACGTKFGENIPINFEMYLPAKESSNFYSKRKSDTTPDFVGLKAGIDELITKPISLIVVPRLLKDDQSIYHFGNSRQIKLNVEKNMNWNQFIKVDTLHSTRGLSTDNRVVIEFDVRLFPHQPRSILVKRAVSSTGKDQHHESKKAKVVTNTLSPIKNISNGTNSTSSRSSKTNTPDEVVILDEKPTKEMIKLEAMCTRFATDMHTLLTSSAKSDVTFTVEGDIQLKAHSLILSARSSALSELLTDEKMAENRSWAIPAEDIEPEVMNYILEYIYTGKLGAEFEKKVHQLLLAAHRFELKELIEYLDLKVPDLLTVDNISNFLILSKQMELKHLEKVMTEYFVKHRAEVVQTSGFADLREKNPGILVDWLLASSTCQ